ncbi:MAG TPA: fused MFS/spermidine synthase [Bryobacteraceae bacterium]|jgi:hypothetical protein|nr:fused MFS/spermidine synthase [Bryobacteraceae bacterium]
MASTFAASPDIAASSSGKTELSSNNAGHAISGLVIFLGAFLLFQIQPMIAKMILPWFGGSAVVWTACMLFFQTMLLLGYMYAHWLSGRTSPRAYWLHIGLLAASLLLLPVIPSAWWKPAGDENPLPRILGLLAVTVGGPYFLLSSTGPLVQTWYARRFGGATPYRLFSLSNLASLLALLSYPVLVEPWIPTHLQGVLWSCEYAVFALLLAWLAYGSTAHPSLRLNSSSTTALARTRNSERPSWRQRAMWIVLPACASFLLLATTNHLCQNIAVVPFLWIVPLSLYLLSFILCFDRAHWYRRKLMLPLFAATLAGAGYLLTYEVPGSLILLHIVAYVLTLFIACMFCHGELALRKPVPAHLTEFYLMVSLGGAAGSALVAVAAPLLFRSVYEFSLGLAACAALALILEYRKSMLTDALWAGLAVWLVVVAGAQITSTVAGSRFMARSLYGSVRVSDSINSKTGEPERTLVHGVIAHGVQVLSPAFRREPTAYFGRLSGAGRALDRPGDPPLKVGIIGLGAGTMAAYGRPGDEYRFYELDPLIIQTAQDQFTFLRDSGAKVEVVAGDGRLALERERERRFDVLAVDAFSGDSIPVHLLTREAFQLYFDRLNPHGVLALHLSNSFLDLPPVAGRAAQALGKFARVVEVSQDFRQHRAHSQWVLLADSPQTLDRLLPLGSWSPAPAPAWLRPWTDDYSNLFQILK